MTMNCCPFANLQRDDIQPTELTPWIGFVYTFPQYRGHHYAEKLFLEIKRIAIANNVRQAYISTDHMEKYGCEFYRMMNDINGEPSRVYIMRFEYMPH